MYSTGLSSVQLLPNGNTLIASGRQGYAFELTPDEEIVWEYVNPMQGGNPVDQGTVVPVGANQMFRFLRYSKDYPAFDGRDLTPIGFLELLPDPEFCALPLGLASSPASGVRRIFPNPANDLVYLDLDPAASGQLLQIFDIGGRAVFQTTTQGDRLSVDVQNWPAGAYAVRMNGVAAGRIMLVD
jgi:hypothetical protein